MKLLLESMKRIYSLYEENMIRKNYKRGIWQFYICYNLASSYLGLKDKNYKKKNIYISRLIRSQEGINSVVFRKIQKFMQNDTEVVFEAIRNMEDEKESDFSLGSYYQEGKGYIAILANDVQE